jgi:hypothetical protein
VTAQDTLCLLLYRGCLIHFPHNVAQLLLKTGRSSNNSKHFTLSLKLITLTCTLFFGYHFCLVRHIFTKYVKILSRSHNDLNTTDHDRRQAESFSALTKLCNTCTSI